MPDSMVNCESPLCWTDEMTLGISAETASFLKRSLRTIPPISHTSCLGHVPVTAAVIRISGNQTGQSTKQIHEGADQEEGMTILRGDVTGALNKHKLVFCTP